MFGRLEYDRATSGQRRRKLPRREQQRRIPRRDCHDDTDRLVAGEVEGVRLVDRNDRSFYLVREAAIIIIPLRQVSELRAHFGKQLSVVPYFERRELLRIASD